MKLRIVNKERFITFIVFTIWLTVLVLATIQLNTIG